MGYPLDLDEIPDTRLVDELLARKHLRDAGKCDYCRRPMGSEPSCKFPDRHNPGPVMTPRYLRSGGGD